MASERAVAAMMRMFSRNFAGEVTKERCILYHAALQDVGDEELEAATKKIIQEHRGEFIPPVAVIRDSIGANARGSSIDATATMSAISGLGEYHVESGRWRYPSTRRVAEKLGDAIAEAYGEAGGPLLFATSEVTREIAQRDFVRALSRASQRVGPGAIALPGSRPPLKLLEDGE